MRTAIEIARPGGAVGRVGVPQDEAIPASTAGVLQQRHRERRPRPGTRLHRGTSARRPRGPIEPGRVFDRVVGLDEVPDGYRAMNEREAIKVMVKP